VDKPQPPLRKRSIQERRTWWTKTVAPDQQQAEFWTQTGFGLNLADTLVENAVGWMPTPLGIVSGLVVNDHSYEVPLATEEPSVIAAANFAASLTARAGGFRAGASPPLMKAQVFLESTKNDAENALELERSALETAIRSSLQSLESRGGGLRNLSWSRLKEPALLTVTIDVDVRDAMGANKLNTLAEFLSPLLEAITQGRKLMAILSNEGSRRTAWSEVCLPFSLVARGTIDGQEMARRVALASQLAQHDPARAVTHNKGVMNGISALALATANDTRAIEAAAHHYASRTGKYQGLSHWECGGEFLKGRLEIPTMFAAVGGTVGVHPTAQMALSLLEKPTAPELGMIAASLGLAQNLAALLALTGEGIQRGHMSLHDRRSQQPGTSP